MARLAALEARTSPGGRGGRGGDGRRTAERGGEGAPLLAASDHDVLTLQVRFAAENGSFVDNVLSCCARRVVAVCWRFVVVSVLFLTKRF